MALFISLPNPVVGAYVIIFLGMLFVVGMKMTMRGGLDYRNSLVVGISFWIGVDFEYDFIFPNLFSGFWAEVFVMA